MTGKKQPKKRNAQINHTQEKHQGWCAYRDGIPQAITWHSEKRDTAIIVDLLKRCYPMQKDNIKIGRATIIKGW